MKSLSSNPWVKSLIFTLFLLGLFLFVKYIFQFQFGGYDLSPLIDLTYRLDHSQRPGIDFINPFPLSVLFWLKINLLFFHNNYDFLFYSGFTHFVFCSCFIFILILDIRRVPAISKVLIFFILAMPLLVTNHIWHSSFSQYNVIVLLAVISKIIFSSRVRSIDYIILFLFTGLTFYSKQNIGVLAVFVSAFILVILYKKKVIESRECMFIAMVAISSIVFYTSVILLVLNIDFNAVIKAYTTVAKRAIPSIDQIINVFYYDIDNRILTLVAVPFSAIIFYRISRLKLLSDKMQIFILLNLGMQAVGYYAFITNWDIKYNDYPLILISDMLLLDIVLMKKFEFQLFRYVVFGLFAAAGYFGYIRTRMEKVGYGAFYERGKLYEITNGYLAGLNCGPKLFSINQELSVLKKIGYLNRKVFFGPRMEFSYAQYSVSSPLNMPLWWHPGSSYAIRNEKKVVQTFEDLHFDVLIFLKNDRTRMPGTLLNYIDSSYHIDRRSDNLDIYTKAAN